MRPPSRRNGGEGGRSHHALAPRWNSHAESSHRPVKVSIALLGGRLMAGSLDLLAQQFPGSQLRLTEIAALFGETTYGPVSRTVTAGLEAALFCAVTAAAILFAQRRA